MAASTARAAGWDPLLIISQIVSLQALHYLTLCILIPPLLSTFAEPNALSYEGGAANVGMIMDWREIAGYPTVHGLAGDDRRGWSLFRGAYSSSGEKLGTGTWLDQSAVYQWDGRTDPMRGWVVAGCWLIASLADVYYLYAFIRRPRLILDFALTLLFNHIVLTTYYSASLPTSIFFWVVVLAGSGITIVCAEQACVKREMKEGLQLTGTGSSQIELEDMETGRSGRPRMD